MRFAMVDSNGTVTNVTEWDGNTDPASGGWQPPADVEMVKETEATGPALIGGHWDGSTFALPQED